MKKSALFILAFVAVLFISCASVPLTGRNRIMLVSDNEVLSSSLTQYNEYMTTATRSTNTTQAAMVQRVGKKIAAATEKFLTDNGLANEVAMYQWEFNLVKDEEMNAFCMPGGKIVVYEGIMPLCESDDDLAVVIGHEVAHAVAKHSNERLSQQMLASYGSAILDAALSTRSEAARQLGQTVYGLGANYGVMLPYSRKHELEADHMGLIFMAMAGYDPAKAIAFWQKMAAASPTPIPPFMSSHPSDAKRITEIEKYLPDAQKYYTK
jgi:predicted Zn-dependent protease